MIVFLLAVASAHHGTAVGQVGPDNGLAVGVDEEAAGTQVSVAIDAQSRLYGKVLRGRDLYLGAGVSAVQLHQLSVSPSISFANGLSFGLRLPFGLARTTLDAGEASLVGGISDASLKMGWRRGILQLRSGLSAPTGRYQSGEELSFTDVTAADGQLISTTYDTRASLGSGAWSAEGGVGLRAPLGKGAVLASSSVSAPFTATPEGITWGSTVSGLVGASTSPWEGVGFDLLLDARHHYADERMAENDAGVVTLKQFGRRTALGLAAGMKVRVASGVRCNARLHAPFWQKVEGIQLVQSASFSMGCVGARRVGGGEDEDHVDTE